MRTVNILVLFQALDCVTGSFGVDSPCDGSSRSSAWGWANTLFTGLRPEAEDCFEAGVSI